MATLTLTPENPYPWSRVGVFKGRGKGFEGYEGYKNP